MTRDPIDYQLHRLRQMVEVQCYDGNWNYDPYMLGLANGLILAEHTMSGREGEPCFKEAPHRWLADQEETEHTHDPPLMSEHSLI